MNDTVDFDAIVVGSGISGGWAAKELTEKGLKVLVLERGRNVEHSKDYVTEHKGPWEINNRNRPLRELYAQQYPVQSGHFVFDETTRHFMNNDRDNPYQFDEENPFHWIRTDVLGGRSLVWGRQVYRWSELDFRANAADGHGVDWPIAYDDIKDWYSHVEKFIGVSGQAEGLEQLPDGEFMPPMKMNVVEQHFKAQLEQQYDDRIATIGRVAILTRNHNGRGQCHYCGPCERGCSTGSYFSSLSSTLPAAKATGNLTLRTDSVVEKLVYDANTQRVTGVKVIDAHSGESLQFSAKLVFLCASTIASTQILLNSKSATMPDGLANGSGVLGHYLMDHSMGMAAVGSFEGFGEDYYYGNRPNVVYVPRFRNLRGNDPDADFIRGYGFQALARRSNWRGMYQKVPGFGADYKQALRQPAPWSMMMFGYGECLPDYNNKIELSGELDRFGIPQAKVTFNWGANDLKMREDIASQAKNMLEAAGANRVYSSAAIKVPGGSVHEMGSARMGRDPATSVLNGFNQAHEVPNLYVTDGACMTSSSCVNPSLTYMALTARAVDHAVKTLQSPAL
jgi:glucoside 3-dehydrogenase (cytochrome c) catalytic subunit